MLHHISLASLCLLVPVSVCFPMCTDGQSPLMEANDAFPCARGCPMGFYCEMQDPLLTPSMGICCANRTELRQLYGDDNREHADPIWDRKTPRKNPNTAISSAAPPPPAKTPVINQVDTTEPFLSGSTESPNSTSPVTSGADLSSSFPEPTTLPVDANSVTVGADDENFDESSPQSVTVAETQVTTEESPDAAKASTSAASAMGEDQTSSSTLNKADGPIVEQTTPTLMPLQPLDGSTDQVTPTDPPTGTSPELPASDSQVMSLVVEGQDLVEGSSVPLEDAPIVTSTVDDHTLTEELNVDSTVGGVGAPQVEERPSAPEEMVREVAVHEPLLGESATKVDQPIEENVAVDPVDVASPTKTTKQDSLATDGEQATYSCDRQRYIFRCRSDSVDTQPTIRWYLNEKGECEYYPWGYCPGDRVMDSSTIRTKADCERECLNGAKNRTEDTPFAARLPEATLAGSPEQDIETGTDLPSEKLESKEKPEETLTPAPVTNVTLEVSASPGPEEKSTTDLSAVAHDETMNAMADQEDSMESHSQEESSSTTEPVTAANTKDSSNPGEAEARGEEGQDLASLTAAEGQNGKPQEEAVDDAIALAGENVHNQEAKISDSAEAEEVESTTQTNEPNQTEQGSATGAKRAENVKAKGSEEVQCSRSAYRFLCKNGMPSQFVYRWEMENGTCQSFPYGYCLNEWNHPHPRTAHECEHFCKG